MAFTDAAARAALRRLFDAAVAAADPRVVLARHLPADCADWHAFVCGPTPMLRIAERALGELGLPGHRVHSEIFDLA